MEWTNYGDVNYLEYGGHMVKPHWDENTIKKYPSLASMYDVFVLYPDADSENVLATLVVVDLDDHSDICDNVIQNGGDKLLAASEIVAICGIEDGQVFSGNPYPQKTDYFISRKQAKKFMQNLGISM